MSSLLRFDFVEIVLIYAHINEEGKYTFFLSLPEYEYIIALKTDVNNVCLFLTTTW